MFLVIVLTIWTALHIYVFWRAATVPMIARHIPRKVLAGIALFLWLVFPVSHSVAISGFESVTRIFSFIGATWVGVLFLLFVSMFAIDVITAFGFLFRRAAPALRGWALLAGCILAAIALVQGSRAPMVRSFDVQIANLPTEYDGTVVVVASDMHLGELAGARWLSPRIDQINAEKPDLVVLAGDIIEGHGESGREFLPLFRKLSPPLGVWAVNGNHERFGRPDAGGGLNVLEGAGVHVLRDQWEQLRPGLLISGVDDLTSRRTHGQPYAEYVDRALAGRPAGATIFVSHTPWLADRAANRGASLMLSAHTHNGQIWPFNYFVRLTYPLMSGRYDVHGMPVIVCRGTGTWGPRMRLWQRSEILRVVLRAPQTSAKSSTLPE